MNAKKLLALSLACTLTLGLSACGGGQDAPSSSSPSGASDGDALKVGIILSTGGLGDKNFNDMTYAGAQQAEKTSASSLTMWKPRAPATSCPTTACSPRAASTT